MNGESTKRGFHVRGFVSLLLSGLFLLTTLSGVALYLAPRCRVARGIGWTFLGVEKEQWRALHINVCWLLFIAILAHLILNWKIFYCYFKKKTSAGLNLKCELTVAVLVIIIFPLGILWHIPPFNYVMDLNNSMKEHWDERDIGVQGLEPGQGQHRGQGKGQGRSHFER